MRDRKKSKGVCIDRSISRKPSFVPAQAQLVHLVNTAPFQSLLCPERGWDGKQQEQGVDLKFTFAGRGVHGLFACSGFYG